MDEEEINRLLADLGLELPEPDEDDKLADRFVEGWDEDGNLLAGWREWE